MNNQLLLLINGWAGKNHLLDDVMIFCASYLIYIVFLTALVCVGYMAYKREWRSVIYFFSALIVSYGLLKLASLTNFDHRPFMDHHLTQLVAHAGGKSFPSDHTTVATAIAAALLFFSPFKKTAWLLVAAACLIGFARVFAGIHYPADIIGGLVTGFVGGALVLVVKKLIEPKRQTVIFDPK
jgi:undecaprenyl-diphosphatase